jgi:hypothetical protein
MSEDGQPARLLEHSPFGIASLLIALSVGAIGALSCGAVFRGISTPYGNWPMAILSLAILCGGPVTALIGIPLGLLGVFQKGKRKLFGVLGLTFNILFILSVLLLIFVLLPALVQY